MRAFRRSTRRVLAALGLASLVVVAGCRGCRQAAAPPTGQRLRFDRVPVKAEGLAVEVRDLRVDGELDGTKWSFSLVCQEKRGCHGSIRLTVHYRADGEARELRFDRQVSLAQGEQVRLGRTRRPPEGVQKVERVSVKLLQRVEPGSPRPTPFV